MDFTLPDAAPEAQLNAILWHDAKGWRTPLPSSVHAAFAPYEVNQSHGGKEDGDWPDR
jgi:hypothetical protein